MSLWKKIKLTEEMNRNSLTDKNNKLKTVFKNFSTFILPSAVYLKKYLDVRDLKQNSRAERGLGKSPNTSFLKWWNGNSERSCNLTKNPKPINDRAEAKVSLAFFPTEKYFNWHLNFFLKIKILVKNTNVFLLISYSLTSSMNWWQMKM